MMPQVNSQGMMFVFHPSVIERIRQYGQGETTREVRGITEIAGTMSVEFDTSVPNDDDTDLTISPRNRRRLLRRLDGYDPRNRSGCGVVPCLAWTWRRLRKSLGS